jgi:hypothetical protein
MVYGLIDLRSCERKSAYAKASADAWDSGPAPVAL